MSRLVDGIRLPHAVAGHPALELCNTRAIWWTTTPVEYLHDYPSLVVLARELGLLTAEETAELRAVDRADPSGGVEVLQQVLRLRADVYASVADDPEPTARENVRRAVLEAVRLSTYRRLEDGGWRSTAAPGSGYRSTASRWPPMICSPSMARRRSAAA